MQLQLKQKQILSPFCTPKTFQKQLSDLSDIDHGESLFDFYPPFTRGTQHLAFWYITSQMSQQASYGAWR